MHTTIEHMTAALKPLISTFAAGSEPAPEQRRYFALRESVAKLRAALASEAQRRQQLEARIQELDAQRIEALTEHRLSAEDCAAQRAAGLAAELEPLRSAAADAGAIAAGIDARIAALLPALDQAATHARQELGRHLEQQFAELAARYQAQAPEVAELAVQLAAVQALMVRFRCGNSNGFGRDIRLPTITPGDAREAPTLVDGRSAEFDRLAGAIANELAGELTAAGYSSR